ncbi:MAG: hypothetical protein OXD46_04585 [Chloroflexi bacterium]|nr:hypothetical protein [Chloroflexota bacterium]
MKAHNIVNRRNLSILVGAIVLALFATACPAQDSPIPIGERATPTKSPAAAASTSSGGQSSQSSGPVATFTPLPTLAPQEAVATVEAREVEHLASLFEPTEGAVKFAEWEDKSLQFSNALLGYILVYAYDFQVELVQLEGEAYQEAFQNGELDAVLMLDKDEAGGWYTTHIDGQAITDLGSVRDGDGDVRIVVHSGLSERAPEVVDFLTKARPTDELIDELSAVIRGGRIGIKPTTQAIKFLKNHENIWSSWVHAEGVEKVKAAIAAGKTSLVNRKCIPDGGSGGGSPNCGT